MSNKKYLFILLILFLNPIANASIEIQLKPDPKNIGQLSLYVNHSQKNGKLTISNRSTGMHRTFPIRKDEKHQYTLPKALSDLNVKSTIYDIVIKNYYNDKNYDADFTIRKKDYLKTENINDHLTQNNDFDEIYDYANQQALLVANRVLLSFGERERYDRSLAIAFYKSYKNDFIDFNDPYTLKGFEDGLKTYFADNSSKKLLKDSIEKYFNKTIKLMFTPPKRLGNEEFSIAYYENKPNTLFEIFLTKGNYLIRTHFFDSQQAFMEWNKNMLGGKYDHGPYKKMQSHEKALFCQYFKEVLTAIVTEKTNKTLLCQNPEAKKQGKRLGKIIKGYEKGLQQAAPYFIKTNISSPLIDFLLKI